MPWRQIQSRETNRWITPVVVTDRNEPLLGGHVRTVRSGGNSGQPRRERECTSRSVWIWRHRPSGQCEGPIRKRVVLSLGKGRAGFDALGVTSETLRRVHESRLSWRWTHCLVLLREGTVVLPTDRRSLRNGHAECESHACCGVRRRAAPPSGGSVADSLLLGATPVRPQHVRESPLSWRLRACRSPSGDCGTHAESWSLLQDCHRLRESKICALSWPGCAAPPSGDAG